MKKILTTALILGSLYGVANANEVKPYVSLDAGYNVMNTKDISDDSYTKKANFGLNAGAKYDFGNKMFLGAELYYRLGKLANTSLEDIDEDGYNINIDKDETKIKNTFGAKLYFGYEFNDKLNAFVLLGLNRMEFEGQSYKEYTYNDPYGYFYKHQTFKYTEKKFAPSFGFGANYSFTKNIEARLSYEFMTYKSDWKYLKDFDKIGKHSTKLYTYSIRLGVNYIF